MRQRNVYHANKLVQGILIINTDIMQSRIFCDEQFIAR